MRQDENESMTNIFFVAGCILWFKKQNMKWMDRNLVWIIGTKNGSQISFFYLLKKLTVLDILEGNDATSLLMGMSSTIYDYLCTSMVRRLALFLEFNSKSLNSLIPCGVARWWALLWLYLFSVPISADYSYLQLSIFIIYTLLQGLIKKEEITLHKNWQFSTLLNINVVYYVVQVWIYIEYWQFCLVHFTPTF